LPNTARPATTVVGGVVRRGTTAVGGGQKPAPAPSMAFPSTQIGLLRHAGIGWSATPRLAASVGIRRRGTLASSEPNNFSDHGRPRERADLEQSFRSPNRSAPAVSCAMGCGWTHGPRCRAPTDPDPRNQRAVRFDAWWVPRKTRASAARSPTRRMVSSPEGLHRGSSTVHGGPNLSQGATQTRPDLFFWLAAVVVIKRRPSAGPAVLPEGYQEMWRASPKRGSGIRCHRGGTPRSPPVRAPASNAEEADPGWALLLPPGVKSLWISRRGRVSIQCVRGVFPSDAVFAEPDPLARCERPRFLVFGGRPWVYHQTFWRAKGWTRSFPLRRHPLAYKPPTGSRAPNPRSAFSGRPVLTVPPGRRLSAESGNHRPLGRLLFPVSPKRGPSKGFVPSKLHTNTPPPQTKPTPSPIGPRNSAPPHTDMELFVAYGATRLWRRFTTTTT